MGSNQTPPVGTTGRTPQRSKIVKWLGIGCLAVLGCAAMILLLIGFFIGGYTLYTYFQGEEVGEYPPVEDYLPEKYPPEPGFPELDSRPPPSAPSSPEPPASSSQSEREQLLAAARRYVESNAAPDLEFTLEIQKQLEKWALLVATPTGGETDSAGVIMEKVGGEWVARDMGTYFEDWYDRVPELFE